MNERMVLLQNRVQRGSTAFTYTRQTPTIGFLSLRFLLNLCTKIVGIPSFKYRSTGNIRKLCAYAVREYLTTVVTMIPMAIRITALSRSPRGLQVPQRWPHV